MGLNTIPDRANGDTIDQTWFNILKSIFTIDIVPRNISGVVQAVAGNLGSSTLPWLKLYFGALLSKLSLEDDTGGNVLFKKNGNAIGGIAPIGIILPFGGTSAPGGYLLCDGTSYLRSTWPDLFATIGTAFGAADGTHFNVPDMRGRFLRGQNASTGRDPDASSRTAMNTGGNTGDNVGSIQNGQIQSHFHQVVGYSGGSAFATQETGIGFNDGTQYTVPNGTSAAGGSETRPLNANVNFIIKT